MNFLYTPVYAEGIGEITNNIDNLSSAISNHGPLVVLLSIFFLIFIALILLVLRSNAKMTKWIMNSQKSNDNLEAELLSKFVDGALKTLTEQNNDEIKKAVDSSLKKPLEHLNHNKENDYHKDLVGAFIDVNMAFKDASRYTLKRLNCSRVAIYIFHNGNVSMLGLPFFKMSCIHEWTNLGNSTLRGKSHSDMPLHLFNDFIEDIWRDGFYRVDDVHKSKVTDKSIEEFIAFSNTRSLYMLAIKSMENNAITGFVVAEFDSVQSFEQDKDQDEKVREVLNEMVLKIAPITSNKYIFKKNK